jgi:hypothetical protein
MSPDELEGLRAVAAYRGSLAYPDVLRLLAEIAELQTRLRNAEDVGGVWRRLAHGEGVKAGAVERE